MADAQRKREVGRGERVMPGVWRLRLPLPWPGVPHCNAWAIAAGDGIVLVDTGIHEPGSLAHLERALDQVGLKIEHVRLLVCTHAHADHYGEAATIVERTGCELWMHPAWRHAELATRDPDAALAQRIEIALQSGVPEGPLRRYQEERKGHGVGIKEIVAPDRELVPGVEVETDLGTWSVHETPGHAPSHVCLFQAERRLLVSGDHLLGRVSLYYDFGHTPDPAGEFLRSLDAVERLDARLCLPGHGRTFSDVRGHIQANRDTIHERLDRIVTTLRVAGEPLTAFELVHRVYEGPLNPLTVNWWLAETLAYLRHLEVTGGAGRIDGEPEHWVPAEPVN
jgi:glyoxylase-like metal-dependent hydrolase (beta-lactamase superfamily II)